MRGAVVEQDLQLVDVVGGLARPSAQCMPHELLPIMPPKRAVAVGRRIGTEGERAVSAAFAQLVEDDARLHAAQLSSGSISSIVVHVLREIHHHRDVAALAGEARAAAAREHRRAEAAAGRDGCDHVLGVARE